MSIGRFSEDNGDSNENVKRAIECFYVTSRQPYWCPKTMKRWPCWCPKPVLWGLNSSVMQTLSFVPINLHRCWPREWKHSIGLLSKTTSLHVHHAFLYISLPLLHDYDVKMPIFTFYGGRKQATTSFSFSFWTWVWSQRNQLQGNWPTLAIFSELK